MSPMEEALPRSLHEVGFAVRPLAEPDVGSCDLKSSLFSPNTQVTFSFIPRTHRHFFFSLGDRREGFPWQLNWNLCICPFLREVHLDGGVDSGLSPFQSLIRHQHVGFESSKSGAVSWLPNFHFQDCLWIKATSVVYKDSSCSMWEWCFFHSLFLLYVISFQKQFLKGLLFLWKLQGCGASSMINSAFCTSLYSLLAPLLLVT